MAKEIFGSIGPVAQLIMELLKLVKPAEADVIASELDKLKKENSEKYEKIKKALVPPFDIPALNDFLKQHFGL
jgi:hypothetical protein